MTNGKNTLGQSARHVSATDRIFHAIQQALLSILIALVGGVVVGIVAAEVIAAIVAQTPPTLTTNLISLAVGLIVGYGTAVTVVVWALIVGLAETARALAGDIERAGDRVLHELESLAGVTNHHDAVEGSVVHHDHPVPESMLGGFAQVALQQTEQRVVEVLTPGPVTQPNNHRNGQASDDVIGPLMPTPSGR